MYIPQISASCHLQAGRSEEIGFSHGEIMSPSSLTALIDDIRHNCEISDARDHGIYSMCTLVLKLRNLYKWENALQPWEEPEVAILLDWIDAKENYWATLAEEPFRPLSVSGKIIDPFDLEDVNETMNGTLLYGAGFGRSLKTVFFLAEKREQRMVEGCPVMILGREQAREMASPFAMVQDGRIIIRTQSLRYYFWDQIQEVRSSCRSSLQLALVPYGVLTGGGALDQQRFRETLDTIVEEEMNLFIYHEVGEILQTTLTSASLRAVISCFPGSVLEFVSRAVKDVLADTHPRGLLAYIVRERRRSSLGFYLTFLDGLRKTLFPEAQSAWQLFLSDGDWNHIERARHDCWRKNQLVAEQIATLALMIGTDSDEKILTRFNTEVLAPLGLNSTG